MDYKECMKYIHDLGKFGMNFGLERTERILELLLAGILRDDAAERQARRCYDIGSMKGAPAKAVAD